MTPKFIGETRYSCGVCEHTIRNTSHFVGEIKEYQLNYLHYPSKEIGNITDGT